MKKILSTIPIFFLLFGCSSGPDKGKLKSAAEKFIVNGVAEGGKVKELEIIKIDTISSSLIALIKANHFLKLYEAACDRRSLSAELLELRRSINKASFAFSSLSNGDKKKEMEAEEDVRNANNETVRFNDSTEKYYTISDTASKKDIKGYEVCYRVKYEDKRGVVHSKDSFYLQFNNGYEVIKR